MTNLADLTAATQETLLCFLRTDLEVCSTFLDITETELTRPGLEHARHTFKQAEHGYDSIKRFTGRIANPEQREKLETGLASLRSRLDALKPRLG
jgi:hypothetical protein